MQGLGDLSRRFLARAKRAGKLGGRQHAVADGGEIARAAAANRQTGERAGEIGRHLQLGAGVGARRDILDETRHRIQSLPDGVRIGERRRQPLCEEPRACRGHAAVDRFQQRAAPLAGERAHQFEIAAGGLVDRD